MVRCEDISEVRELSGDGASFNFCRCSPDLCIRSNINRFIFIGMFEHFLD